MIGNNEVERIGCGSLDLKYKGDGKKENVPEFQKLNGNTYAVYPGPSSNNTVFLVFDTEGHVDTKRKAVLRKRCGTRAFRK